MAPGERETADAAFTAFVSEYGVALRRYAVALTGSPTAADDLLQDSLTKLYLAWGRIDDPTATPAYARRIMARTHVSWWRRLSSREYPAEIVPDAASPPVDLSDADLVWRALARLGPRGGRWAAPPTGTER